MWRYAFSPAEGEGTGVLRKTDRNELKLLLRKAFDQQITEA